MNDQAKALHAHSFRRCLEECDVMGLWTIWSQVFPNMPQPKSLEAAEITLHMARTAAESMHIKLRAYSHRWLTERNHRSLLPDNLKPAAERIYPKVVGAVGISVNFQSEYMRPAADIIKKVMSDSVLESYAEGEKRPEVVKARMLEKKDREMKSLFGKIARPT